VSTVPVQCQYQCGGCRSTAGKRSLLLSSLREQLHCTIPCKAQSTKPASSVSGCQPQLQNVQSFPTAAAALLPSRSAHTLLRRGPTLRECVLLHAVARLVLHPHITNIQASWVKMGPQAAGQLLAAGCNDMGGSIMNESITRAAGRACIPGRPNALRRSLYMSGTPCQDHIWPAVYVSNM
jgi:hypothetical protein